MKRRYWTPAEEALLRERYATTRTDELARQFGRPAGQVLRKANSMGLSKSRDLIVQMLREAVERPDHPSRAHRLKKGHVPANKGIKRPPGWAPGRMAEGQFKPGLKPHTWVPVGSLRIVNNKNGGPELQRKVNDDPGPSSVRWKPVARLVWEAEHGPVPDGMIVVFRPGMRTTDPDLITIDRLDCITRIDLMRRNSVHNLPPEFAEVARLKAVLHRAINTRAKKEATA
jgi:hypothetical protein